MTLQHSSLRARTIIPISGFDKNRLNPPSHIRFATNGETFTGIGMNKPRNLTDKMLVLADEKQILCIYPYRDSDKTKITEQTRNVIIVGYGGPGITEKQLKKAAETATSYVSMVSDGETGIIKVFSRTPK